MRFRFVEEQRGAFPTNRLCEVMNVSPRGLRAFRSRRPASRRQRADMVVLATSTTHWRLQKLLCARWLAAGFGYMMKLLHTIKNWSDLSPNAHRN